MCLFCCRKRYTHEKSMYLELCIGTEVSTIYALLCYFCIISIQNKSYYLRIDFENKYSEQERIFSVRHFPV